MESSRPGLFVELANRKPPGNRKIMIWGDRDKVGALITCGVLIDVAGLKGVDILSDTYEIAVR
jgi:hypothetical protein